MNEVSAIDGVRDLLVLRRDPHEIPTVIVFGALCPPPQGSRILAVTLGSRNVRCRSHGLECECGCKRNKRSEVVDAPRTSLAAPGR